MIIQEQSKETSKHTSRKLNLLVVRGKAAILDIMIVNETPAMELVAWCNYNEFPISLPTTYSYMKQRREAIVNGLTMEPIHSKQDTLKNATEDSALKKVREKGSAQFKENRAEERAKVKATLEKELADQDSLKRSRHDMELLDEVIQKASTR